MSKVSSTCLDGEEIAKYRAFFLFMNQHTEVVRTDIQVFTLVGLGLTEVILHTPDGAPQTCPQFRIVAIGVRIHR